MSEVMPGKNRLLIKCQNCKYWGFDMDMDPFCQHPCAGPIGTDTNAMRGLRKLQHARENCGPDAKFFEQGLHTYAVVELNA